MSSSQNDRTKKYGSTKISAFFEPPQDSKVISVFSETAWCKSLAKRSMPPVVGGKQRVTNKTLRIASACLLVTPKAPPLLVADCCVDDLRFSIDVPSVRLTRSSPSPCTPLTSIVFCILLSM